MDVDLKFFRTFLLFLFVFINPAFSQEKPTIEFGAIPEEFSSFCKIHFYVFNSSQRSVRVLSGRVDMRRGNEGKLAYFSFEWIDQKTHREDDLLVDGPCDKALKLVVRQISACRYSGEERLDCTSNVGVVKGIADGHDRKLRTLPIELRLDDD